MMNALAESLMSVHAVSLTMINRVVLEKREQNAHALMMSDLVLKIILKIDLAEVLKKALLMSVVHAVNLMKTVLVRVLMTSHSV